MSALWSHLPLRGLIDVQRAQALREMGERARALPAEGYAVDADRVMDDICERVAGWDEESA